MSSPEPDSASGDNEDPPEGVSGSPFESTEPTEPTELTEETEVAEPAVAPPEDLPDLPELDEEVWLEGEIEQLDESNPRPLPNRRSPGAAGVVAAAMLGLGEVLEPEKTNVEIVQVDDQPLEPPPIKLDFSDVPKYDREPPDNKSQI